MLSQQALIALFALTITPSNAFNIHTAPPTTRSTFIAQRQTRSTVLSASTQEKTDSDIFAPFKDFLNSFQQSGNGAAAAVKNEYDEPIAAAKLILNKAVQTKKEDPEEVLGALEGLEKLMRKKCSAEPDAASDLLRDLDGEWQLVFTTGTKDSQKKLGAKINYFPIKAAQGFDTSTSPMRISNGIYLGDIAVVKFFGEFEYDVVKRKIEFDFDQIALFGFIINLPKGKAAEIGAASGLGSENNAKLIAKNKKPFFNWISADETIATARGGGGGLALWKRIPADDEA